jgi:hypothetical protein
MENEVRRVVGVFRNGRVEIEGTVDWPEGSRVVVSLNPDATKFNSDDRLLTPEETEELIHRMESFEPVVLTEREEHEIAEWRAEMKRFNVEAMRRKMRLGE